jgi:hypothetical protein
LLTRRVNAIAEPRLWGRYMRKITSIFLASIIVAACSMTDTPSPAAGNSAIETSFLRQDMPYIDARQQLKQAGWQGVTKYPPPEQYSSTSSVYYEDGFTEVQDCSGTGRALCKFLFRDAHGRQLEVVTYGEIDYRIDSWTLK